MSQVVTQVESSADALHATVLNTPVRADLAATTPVYYPIIEQRRFGSTKAMCRSNGWPPDQVQPFIDRARLERSSLVVMDCMTLGDPANEVLAVLILQPGGAVILCAGLFAEASGNEADVKALLAEFKELPTLKGRLVAVGEFRQNRRRVAPC